MAEKKKKDEKKKKGGLDNLFRRLIPGQLSGDALNDVGDKLKGVTKKKKK